MIVLDTNVVSELIHPRSGTTVVYWADRQPSHSLYPGRGIKENSRPLQKLSCVTALRSCP